MDAGEQAKAMDEAGTNTGTPTSWMDTVPMASVPVAAFADEGTVSDDAASPKRKRASAPASTRQAGEEPRKKKRKTGQSSRELSVWHRPLGEVVGGLALKLAGRAPARDRSRALSVIPPPSFAKPEPSLVFWPLMVLGQAVRSVTRLLPSPAPAKALAPASSASTPSKTSPRAGAAKAKAKANTKLKVKTERAPARAPLPAAAAQAVGKPSAPDRAPLTRPSGEMLGAFLQQLYADAGKTLMYDSNGMGVLWVQSAAGVKHVAGPEAKWYFLAVMKRFEELGETMNKFNPRYVAMTRSFAEALLEHPTSDPIWRQITSDDPRTVARCFAGLDKPQNVVDIPASSIHKAPSAPGTTVVSA